VRALAAYLAVVSNQTSLLFDLQLAIVVHLFTYLSKEKREIFGVPCRSAPFPSVHSGYHDFARHRLGCDRSLRSMKLVIRMQDGDNWLIS
jgi:hypothetical protein